MRSLVLALFLFAVIAGCGGPDVQTPENPAPPPQDEIESTSATVSE